MKTINESNRAIHGKIVNRGDLRRRYHGARFDDGQQKDVRNGDAPQSISMYEEDPAHPDDRFLNVDDFNDDDAVGVGPNPIQKAVIADRHMKELCGKIDRMTGRSGDGKRLLDVFADVCEGLDMSYAIEDAVKDLFHDYMYFYLADERGEDGNTHRDSYKNRIRKHIDSYRKSPNPVLPESVSMNNDCIAAMRLLGEGVGELFEDDPTTPSGEELKAAMLGAYKKLWRKFWDNVEGEWGGEPDDWKCRIVWDEDGGYSEDAESRPSSVRFSQEGGTGARFTYVTMPEGDEISLETMARSPEYYPILLDFESGDFELEPQDGIYQG